MNVRGKAEFVDTHFFCNIFFIFFRCVVLLVFRVFVCLLLGFVG